MIQNSRKILKSPKTQTLSRLNNIKTAFAYLEEQYGQARKIYPCIKLINFCCGCCVDPTAAIKCCWKNYQKVDLSKVQTPEFELLGKKPRDFYDAILCCVCLWWNYPNEHDCEQLKRKRNQYSTCCWKD